MKKGFTTKIIILVTIFLAACAPSSESIQTAIAQTLAAVPTSTLTPIPPTNTPYETPTVFFIASATNAPVLPTPVTYTFILEDGFCLLQAGKIESAVDPKTSNLCSVSERNQIEMILDAYIELTPWNDEGRVEPYCALFTLEGSFIMSDIDTTGSGKVQCGPPQGYRP